MNNNINSRIKIIYERTGATQVRFAEAIGIDPSYVSQILSDKHTKIPSDRILQHISLLFSVNFNWLKTGEGDPDSRMVSEERAPYARVIPIEDMPREQLMEFIGAFWQKATPDEKAWFKVQFKKSFPEFEAWLNKKETGAAAAG